MRPDVEEIDLATYRRLTASQPRKRAKRQPRADIPRAPADARVGLGPLLKRGWSLAGNDHYQRLYKIGEPAMDTGECADLGAACDKAKELER